MTDTPNNAVAAERLMDRLYSESNFRYPRDFQPAIYGLNAGTDAILRRQICVAAQWVHDHPNESLEGEKFNSLISSMDAFVGHSGGSYAMFASHVAAIKDNGFDAYISQLRESRAKTVER